MEERRNASRASLKETGCGVPISEKGHVDVVYQLAREVRKSLLKSEVDRRELADRDGKIEELNLKVQLLADDSENVAWLKTQGTAKEAEFIASPVAPSRLTKAQDAKIRTYASLQL